MEDRNAKLALARKKLKDHQHKKVKPTLKDDIITDELNKPQTEVGATNLSKPMTDHEKNEVTAFDASANVADLNIIQNQIDITATEMLLSNKRNLEISVCELQQKLSYLESNYQQAIGNYNTSSERVNYLENDLSLLRDKYSMLSIELSNRNKFVEELRYANRALLDEKNELVEQLDFTKTVLTTKETENASINSQLEITQKELEASQIRLQQLTNGSSDCNIKLENNDKNDALLSKISNLENQLNLLQKERDQIHSHYEHYVSELNAQLKKVVSKNEEAANEIVSLTAREEGLIDQISQMEIRLQNLRQNSVTIQQSQLTKDPEDIKKLNELEQKYISAQIQLQELQVKYDEHLVESKSKLAELQQKQLTTCNHENISLEKLHADITNDKIAAQRATEQNRKLKTDLQELEEAFVKMSKDKLELTEKLDAEKFLNRELTLKLAEIDENAKDMQVKLQAKDVEMMRLLANSREIEKKIESYEKNETATDEHQHNGDYPDNKETDEENIEPSLHAQHEITNQTKVTHDGDSTTLNNNIKLNELSIPKENAMLQLQDRFLRIMEEVASLSDEKHRLEHIIMQLQSETDTICEYVALYQQQRSLLKKRDEERNSQIILFQAECNKMKSQLDELHTIILNISEDKTLASYFQTEAKRNEMLRVLDLLKSLKENCLVNSEKQCTNIFYPCACCSGNLIDV